MNQSSMNQSFLFLMEAGAEWSGLILSRDVL
jgi:hypothetical protein